MPQAIPYLAAYVGTVLGGSAALYYVAAAVLVGAYQADRARKAAHALQDSFREPPRSVNIRSAIAPRQLVLGKTRVPGILHYAEFVGTNQEYFDTVFVCSHNQLATVHGVYAGQEFIAAADVVSNEVTTGTYSTRALLRTGEGLTVSGGNTVTLSRTPTNTGTTLFVTTGSGEFAQQITPSSVVGAVVTLPGGFAGAGVFVDYDYFTPRPLQLQWVMGTTSQAAMAWSGVSTPKWTANHRCLGMGALRALHVAEHTVYATGYPELTLLATGPCGVWDPRAAAGAGAFIDGTSNPALLAAWYRTLPRSDGGMGIPSTWIDWPSVAAAANICDELITVTQLDGSGTDNIKRYECNVVLRLAGTTRMDNLRIILSAMAGDFPFTGGLYRCFAGAYRAPTYTLTDADVSGDQPITFTPSTGGFKRAGNVMTATIFDEAKGYIETGAPELTNATYVTLDGGEQSDSIDLPATTDARRANYLMGVAMEQRRPALAGQVTLGGVGADIGLLDTVAFSLTDYTELAGKVFEVRQWGNDFGGRYPVGLREVKASTWTLDAAKFTPVSQPAAPDLSYLFNVSPLTSLAVASGTTHRQVLGDGTVIARLRATWDLHAQAYVRETGTIELRWKRAGAAAWINEAPMPGDSTAAYLFPASEGELYLVEGRALNGRGNWSEWKPAVHQAQAITGSQAQADLVLVAHGTTAALLVRGNTVKRITATGSWDAGVHSKAPLRGACAIGFSCASPSFMVGLNTDPTTDASYTSIDYAWFCENSGNSQIYESGSLKVATVAHAAGDAYRIIYTGSAVQYWQNATLVREVTAPANVVFYLDSSFITVGAEVTGLTFTPNTPAPRGNLIDSSSWVVGSTGSQGTPGSGSYFGDTGNSGESSIVMATGPDGELRTVWRATSGDNLGTGDPDGGWESTGGRVPIDPTKMYRFAVWFNPRVIVGSNPGSCYLGCEGNSVAAIATGTADSNPYFHTNVRSTMVQARWYLKVGYVLPSGFGTTPPSPALSAVYDGVTGQRVASGVDFKWVAGMLQSYHRAFMYYADTSNQSDFYRPRLDLCDGSEPTIAELLSSALAFANAIKPLSFSEAHSLNGQFTNWLLGNTYPDGWAVWVNANAHISKETTVTRSGPNAVRMVPSGGEGLGMNWLADFHTAPLAAGAYFEVQCDAYVVTNTSGGAPGLLVLLYTDSGLTVFREFHIQVVDTVTGAWQSVKKLCSVNAGEQIYGVRVYVMGSWSGFAGGTWVGDVIFDSLQVDLKMPNDTLQLTDAAITNRSSATYAPSAVTYSTATGTASDGPNLVTNWTFAYPSIAWLAIDFAISLRVRGQSGTLSQFNTVVAVFELYVDDVLFSEYTQQANGAFFIDGGGDRRVELQAHMRFVSTATDIFSATGVAAASTHSFKMKSTINIYTTSGALASATIGGDTLINVKAKEVEFKK